MKWDSISQDPAKRAVGVPQLLGSGDPEEISDGIEDRGKNHTEITEDVHSVTYTPPELSLKPGPKEVVSGDMMPQPALLSCPAAWT